MGLPALRQDNTARVARPHLRLVPKAKRAPRKATRACSVQTARTNFRIFSAVLIFFALLGVARVWLSVQAAEASMQAGQLRESIRQERYEGDMLEVRQSALGSPSRIRAIAGKAMGMAPASKVDYLDLNAKKPVARNDKATTAAASVAAVPATKVSSAGGMRSAIAKLIDLTAGEAQVLLVGDVGLASVR